MSIPLDPAAWSPLLGALLHHWVFQAFLVIFVALVADFIAKRVLRRMERRLVHATAALWDEAVLHAVRAPLTLLVWTLGLTFAARIAGEATGVTVFDAAGPLRSLGVIAALAWFAVRLVGNLEEAYLRRAPTAVVPELQKLDRSTLDSITRLLRIAVVITAGLVALQTLGFSISGLLAVGGIGGVVMGFAARDVLANFFGSLMIFLDRPFAIGEWIRSPDKEIEGTVEAISWRLTRIRTFDKRPLYVPNATFSSISVENPSRMSHRRIREVVGIRYDDAEQLDAIVADLRGMVENHPDIAADQTIIVNFLTFAPSSLDILLYCFTRTTDWVTYHRVKQDVLLQVIGIITAHGAEVAYPTSTLHVPDGVAVRQQAGGGAGNGTTPGAQAEREPVTEPLDEK